MLRSETARAMELGLGGNAGLRELLLAHNGFSDVDGARIVQGLLKHGRARVGRHADAAATSFAYTRHACR